jgi:HAE1 family hydrophobic/amphiphilic exporter-1
MGKLMTYPGFLSVSSDFYNNTPNLNIELHRDQAKTYGVSEARILTLLRNAYSQNYLYLIKKPEDQYQVILEMEDSAREHPEDLSLLYIKSDDGQHLVPLKELVSWKTILGPQTVNHLNQFTSMTLFFNLKPGVALGDATNFINQSAREIVPPTVRAELQGEAQTFSNTVSSLTVLMALAVFVMYVILAILYESYVHPLTVLSTLPTALVGGLLTLVVFGQEASLYAFVGMFMLMGIVKKNGIMIVDFARQRVEAGEAAEQAIHDASMDRFRPILMTTLAAVFGALPIALGYGADGSSRRPLGLGCCWGARSFAVHHALHHACDLPLPRTVSGKRFGPNLILQVTPSAETTSRPSGGTGFLACRSGRQRLDRSSLMRISYRTWQSLNAGCIGT